MKLGHSNKTVSIKKDTHVKGKKGSKWGEKELEKSQGQTCVNKYRIYRRLK